MRKKATLKTKAVGKKQAEFSTACYIIYNLGQLGISIEDSRYIPFTTYLEICKLNNKNNSSEGKRQSTQEDIDKFLA